MASYPSKPFGENQLTDIILFLGTPIIALLLGAFLSFTLPEKFDRQVLSSTGWIGDSLVIAAPVILITGAGGIFGKCFRTQGLLILLRRI